MPNRPHIHERRVSHPLGEIITQQPTATLYGLG